MEAVDQHQGRGSGDAAVVEPARVRGEFAVGVDVVTAARARGWLSEVFGGVLWVGSGRPPRGPAGGGDSDSGRPVAVFVAVLVD
ncbi:MAG TPA: hypothetical protein VFW54_09770 [Propionibacteriaceae bacterium]|nr:hypothetical protein [Propionibacteriaceae bacterium]